MTDAPDDRAAVTRYHDCPWYVRAWRCRWYGWVVILWVLKCLRWQQTYGDVDGARFYFWHIIKGEIEADRMKRYVTLDELKADLGV